MKLFRFDPAQTSYADVGHFANGDQPLRGNIVVLSGGRTLKGEVVIGRDGIAIDCEDQSWFLGSMFSEYGAALLWITTDLVDGDVVGAYLLKKYGFTKI
jgi:hypothetical protein